MEMRDKQKCDHATMAFTWAENARFTAERALFVVEKNIRREAFWRFCIGLSSSPARGKILMIHMEGRLQIILQALTQQRGPIIKSRYSLSTFNEPVTAPPSLAVTHDDSGNAHSRPRHPLRHLTDRLRQGQDGVAWDG
mmetsp:Transcript_22877/g.67542  ORF Transcript_22877/g.67542 Transcript_22877/m.67542 type:complete len:138 (+) Transcript_22877:3624-4037(+)